MDRIKEKITEIEGFLVDLKEYTPLDFELYKNNPRDKSACERMFEKIVEGTIHLTFRCIQLKGLEQPESDQEIFKILEKAKFITSEISRKLQEAKGMRNILAHEYGKVNDELVYYSITTEIIPDVEEFLKQIKKVILK